MENTEKNNKDVIQTHPDMSDSGVKRDDIRQDAGAALNKASKDTAPTVETANSENPETPEEHKDIKEGATGSVMATDDSLRDLKSLQASAPHGKIKAVASTLIFRSPMGAAAFAFIVQLALILCIFAYLHCQPFGESALLNNDSIHQYYPFFTELRNRLANGEEGTYSFLGAFGYNFLGSFSYYLASPMNLFLAFVSEENVSTFMDLSIAVKTALASAFMAWALKDYEKEKLTEQPLLASFFGIVFASSFYFVGYGYCLMWLDSIMVLPLMIRGIALIDHRKGRNLYLLSLAYAIWSNYYIGYMLCVASVIFFLCTFIFRPVRSFRAFLKRTGRYALMSALGGGLCAWILYPAWKCLEVTQSVAGQDTLLPTYYDSYMSVREALSNFLTGIEPMTISSYAAGLNIYCTAFIPVLFFLFLSERKVRIRERVISLLMIIFLFASFKVNYLNNAWNGFHGQNGLPNRFSFIAIALLVFTAFIEVHYLKNAHFLRIIIAFYVWGNVLYVVYRKNEDFVFPKETEDYILTAVVLFAYMSLLLSGKVFRKAYATVMLATFLMVFEALYCAGQGYISNSTVDSSLYLEDKTAAKELIQEAEEARDDDGGTTWHRSESGKTWMHNFMTYCGERSTIMFNSMMQEDIKIFTEELGLRASMNSTTYDGSTGLYNDLFGVRYVLAYGTNAESYMDCAFVGENTEENLQLFENADALPLGYVVNEDILEWDITQGNPLVVQDNFLYLALGEMPIFKLDRTIQITNDEKIGIRIPEGKSVYIYIQVTDGIDYISLTSPSLDKTYSKYLDHLYCLRGSSESDEGSILVHMKEGFEGSELTGYIYVCADSDLEAATAQLRENALTNIVDKDSRVAAHLTSDQDGILFISLPYDGGWSAMVDGQESKVLKVGDTFIGLRVTEGEHEILLSYASPGLSEGLDLTLFSLFILLLIGISDAIKPDKDLNTYSTRKTKRDADADEEDLENSTEHEGPLPEGKEVSIEKTKTTEKTDKTIASKPLKGVEYKTHPARKGVQV